jgi:hypothetical protein
MIAVNRIEFLSFFDDRVPGSVGHASALIAFLGESLCLGLLKRYLEEDDYEATIIEGIPTPGTSKGQRLDGWMRLNKQGQSKLLQMEVKNWNAHSMDDR